MMATETPRTHRSPGDLLSPRAIVFLLIVIVALLVGSAVSRVLGGGSGYHPDLQLDPHAVANECGSASAAQMDLSRAYMKGDVAVYPTIGGGPDQTVNERTGQINCFVQISPTPLPTYTSGQ